MVYKSWGKIAIATACYAAAPPFFAAGPVPYVNTCVCIPSLRQIAVHVGTTLRSMTTFLGVWHQSLGVTSKWLRVRRGLEGAILGCTAPFSPSYRSLGAVEVAT